MIKRRNYLLLILFACFVLSGLGGNYLSELGQPPNKKNNTVSKKPIQAQKVSQEADIIFGKFFTTCNHLVEEAPDTQLQGLTLEALLKRYPPEDQWVVDNLNPKHIMIYKKETGLCPDDLNKRHLGVKGDFVAVFRGPVGLDGGVERVTDIKIKELPAEFRDKLIEGHLDFANEHELFEALDTIDEYEE